MREIKFRGLTARTHEWVYGSLVNKASIVQDLNGNCSPFDQKRWFAVSPKSVGEYAGLEDKNGKEIYEGDVVQYKNYGYENATGCVVFLYDQGFRIEVKGRMTTLYLPIRSNMCEVLGNIHENSDLLTVS